MVTVVSKKTKRQHIFSDADWELAKQNGLATKYKIIEQTNDQTNPKPIRFSPPELNDKESKPKAKEKLKDKNAG